MDTHCFHTIVSFAFDFLDQIPKINIMFYIYTIEFCKFQVLGKILFRIIRNSNFKQVDIKYTTPKNKYHFFSIMTLYICFGCVKETSRGAVSFTHPKRKDVF